MSALKSMNLTTTLVRNQRALKLLGNSEFLQEWQELIAHSAGFCQLQSPDFLSIWYQVYKDRFDPLIILSKNEKNMLVGLIALAWQKGKEKLVHAGNAEYHGWLATESATRPFLRDVVTIVKEEIKVKKWSWSWLPSGLDVAPLMAAIDHNSYIHVESTRAPIWRLEDEEKLDKLLKSRSLRSKFNRFRNRGDFRFEVIRDAAIVREVLQTAQYQCDFRREAKNNNRPFYEDPCKIEFATKLTALTGALHVSSLWLDKKLLACHVGVRDDQRVCLGMISFDPSESKQSPGTLLLVKLASHLGKNGYNLFDLTPGTDSYKDRFANTYELLYRPTICFAWDAYLKVKSRKRFALFCKKLLAAFQVDIPTMRSWKTNLLELSHVLKTLLSMKALLKIGQASINIKRRLLMEVDGERLSANMEDVSLIEKQNYADLLLYQDSAPFITRRGLLKDALKKFAKGEILFSKSKNKRLQWYCWMKEVKDLGQWCSEKRIKVIEVEGKAKVLYDGYSSSEISSGDYARYFMHALQHLSPSADERLFVLVDKKLSSSFIRELQVLKS